MKGNFEACIAQVKPFEGGYVNDPKDPGGETNWGISKRSYPHLNIRGLSWDTAKAIYERDFWRAQRCDDLPAGVDLVVLDPSINSGRARGTKWLQRALRVAQDGKIGPATIRAAQAADPVAVIRAASAARMGFLRGLGIWSRFGKGWSRRVAAIEAAAIAMVSVGAVAGERELAGKAARREGARAGGAVAGGGGVASVSDLSIGPMIALGVLVLLVIVVALSRRQHQINRAAALSSAMEG